MVFELDRIHMLLRFAACILAAVPSTILPLPLPVTMALTERFKREKYLKRFHLMIPWAHFCRKHILKIDLAIEGRHNIPADSRGHIYISNHQSYVDILVLMEALNTVAFLSKNLVKYIPLIGQHAYAGGTILFDRRRKDSRQAALQDTLRMCRDSTAVVVFPEGTRSADGNVAEKIYPSAIEAAHENGFKVIPVGLDGSYRILPKTMDRVNLGEKMAVTIGQAMNPADYPNGTKWVQAVWARVKEQHGRSRLLASR